MRISDWSSDVCSSDLAMIEKHLGETIDIHAGGQDLIFPHHENEIAQSRCAHHGAPLARYWMHNGFVSMDTEKMSKSLGNVITVADLLAAGHKGETLRLALLSAHYRQPLDWTDALMEQSQATLEKFPSSLHFKHLSDHDSVVVDEADDKVLTPLSQAPH